MSYHRVPSRTSFSQLPKLLLLVGAMFLRAGANAASPSEQAQIILATTGVQGGLVVHLNCGDGKLTAALHTGDGYCIHGLEADAASVEKARAYLGSLGLYGQVAVDRFEGKRLPYIDNLANLVVAEHLGGVPMAEVIRVLCPGGVAFIKSGGEWVKTVKPRPADIDEWNHFLYDAASNPVSRDKVAGPPKHFQWIAGPAWSKHHEAYPPTIPMLVSARGRIFYFEEETPPCIKNVTAKWFLMARDAFNGVLLWRQQVPEWLPTAWPGKMGGGLGGGPADYKRRLIAVGDRLFVTLGQNAPVTELDAATGKTLRALCPGAQSVELLHQNGTLFIVSTPAEEQRIAAYNIASGKKLWDAMGGRGTVALDDRVCFEAEGALVGLDAASGKEAWRTALASSGDADAKRKGRKAISTFSPPSEPLRAGSGVVIASTGPATVSAFSVQNGQRLWSHTNKAGYTGSKYMDVFIRDGLVWVTDAEGEKARPDRTGTLALALAANTGKVIKSVSSDPVWNTGHHRRCYPGKGTDRFIIYSMRGAEFLELETGKAELPPWTRGSCGYGVMPANGLLYSPPHSCRCYSETALRGLTALAPQGTGDWSQGTTLLEQGPAYDSASSLQPPASGLSRDWATYRGDASRSGRAATTVAAQVSAAWKSDLGGKLTQPVVAGRTLLVAAVNEHTVHALDANNGKRLWSFIAGGRVDSPPTIYGGLALFGCADGWAYCLRLQDGALVWRFRGAPHDLRMGAYGQVESLWPVHGSVLVRDGVAYFAAGRSSYLDGGIFAYGVNVATGEKLYEHSFVGPFTEAGMTPGNPVPGYVLPGALPDILVSDGSQIYMRQWMLDPALKESTDMRPNFYPARARTGQEFGGDHKYWCDLYESGLRAFAGKPEWNFRSYFNNFPGVRLYSTTGLLDDSWHIRSYWSYGQIVGQQIVFEGSRGYAVRAYPNAARWEWFEAGQGYELYAGNTAAPGNDEKVYALKNEEHLWKTTLPFRPQSIVLTNGKLFLAGPADSSDPAEALAALEGKRGATLWAVNTANGERMSELHLDATPVFDGLIAARGKVFVAMQDGSVRCFQ